MQRLLSRILGLGITLGLLHHAALNPGPLSLRPGSPNTKIDTPTESSQSPCRALTEPSLPKLQITLREPSGTPKL